MFYFVKIYLFQVKGEGCGDQMTLAVRAGTFGGWESGMRRYLSAWIPSKDNKRILNNTSDMIFPRLVYPLLRQYMSNCQSPLINNFNLMQAEVNRLTNLLRQQEADHLSLNGEKSRLEAQMIILLEENNGLRERLGRAGVGNVERLKEENRRLKEELERMAERRERERGDDDRDHEVEELHGEIERLNGWISEREKSYMEMVGEVEELRKNIAESDVLESQKQIDEMGEEIERWKNEVEEREGEIERLNEEVRELRSRLESEEEEKVMTARNELTSTKNTVSIHAITTDRQSHDGVTMVSSRIDCGSQVSPIEPSQEPEWREKESLWRRQQLKMEEQIKRLREAVAKSEERGRQALEQQSERYERQMSEKTVELAEVKALFNQFKDANTMSKSEANKALRVESKLKQAERTIRDLKATESKYKKLLVVNEGLNAEINGLRKNPSSLNSQNLLQFSTNTSLPAENLYSSTKTFTLNGSLSHPYSPPLPRHQNKDFEQYLILQGKIQRIREQNNYLRNKKSISTHP